MDREHGDRYTLPWGYADSHGSGCPDTRRSTSTLVLWRTQPPSHGKPSVSQNSRVRAAWFDRTVRGAHSLPHTSRAIDSATQGGARDRDWRAAPGKPRGIVATWTSLGRKQEKQRGLKAKPPRTTNSIFRSDYHLPAVNRLTGRVRYVIGRPIEGRERWE